MLFNDPHFIFVFLVATLVLYYRLARQRSRLVLLLVASYVFYGSWDARFVALLALSSGIDFVAGRMIASSGSMARRRLWLTISLISNLGILGVFKYSGFFADNVAAALAQLGWRVTPPALDVVLPVGISFYTFQSMSYTIDVYRGKVLATDSPLKFATYVALFPQLVAGPIVRYSELSSQLDALPERFGRAALSTGIQVFLFGLFKKVLIADWIAVRIDPMLASHVGLGWGDAWMACLGYTFQLYFDFSGYSDMAIGLGLMLGFALPRNFRNPYRAVNPQDFWRRWHVTLSLWLRDYLYVPLGGSRLGTPRTIGSLLVVFGLGGLWHGAAWPFVVWGLYQFLIVSAYQLGRRRWDALPVPLQRAATFVLVVLGWVIFRSENLSMAGVLLGKLAGSAVTFSVDPGGLVALALVNLGLLVLVNATTKIDEFEGGLGALAGVVFALLLVVSLLRINAGQVAFLYYQF